MESGFYDGFALAILLTALALASQQNDSSDVNWAWFIFSTEFLSLLAGGAVGLVGGLVVAWSRRRDWMSDIWGQLATLALALICFGSVSGWRPAGSSPPSPGPGVLVHHQTAECRPAGLSGL